MNHTAQNIMTFAIDQDGHVVHVDEVLNGSTCGCSCPSCHSALIAKNEGKERAHHFAHDGRIEEHSCSETALHFAAKQIITNKKRMLLPAAMIWEEGGEEKIIEFNDVILEHRLEAVVDDGNHIVVDCFGTYGNESMIIEIAVHHEVDLFKLKKIRALNIPSIEISLADIAENPWDWENLTHEVLFSAFRRKWLWQPEPTAEPPIEPPLLSNQLAGHIGLKEWIFDIGGSWVWVRELPYGNMKVFHRPSDYARKVVEPICRNRGFWNKQFKSWIVFDKFKDEILRCLAESGRQLNKL